MATLPSPFYSQYASGSDLSFLVNNVRPNTLFEQAFFGPGTGTDKDDISMRRIALDNFATYLKANRP